MALRERSSAVQRRPISSAPWEFASYSRAPSPVERESVSSGRCVIWPAQTGTWSAFRAPRASATTAASLSPCLAGADGIRDVADVVPEAKVFLVPDLVPQGQGPLRVVVDQQCGA